MTPGLRSVLLFATFLCASACTLRHEAPQFTGYCASSHATGSTVTFDLMRLYPVYHGPGMCGWVSSSSGYAPFRLAVPGPAGRFSDDAVVYIDADPQFIHMLTDPRAYRATVTIDATGIDILLINRTSGATYIHDRYERRDRAAAR